MLPAMEKLNRSVIMDDRHSPEAKKDAINQMWDEVIAPMAQEAMPKYVAKVNSLPEDEQLEIKEKECLIYFGLQGSVYGDDLLKPEDSTMFLI